MNTNEILEQYGIKPAPTSTFIESRVALLKKMHEIMMNMNDEDCYFTWILFVPDEPSDDDFEFIASNDEDWNYALELFERLFHEYKQYE